MNNREISRLNPKQKQAVFTTEGPVLILAGAGSGKTRVITFRTAHLIEKGVSPRSVLAVTFTNKAAKEMRERIKSIFPGKKSSAPIISTFHSVCLKILRNDIEHLGYKKDFTIYDTSEQLSLIRTLMNDTKLDDRSIKPDTLLEQMSWRKNGLNRAIKNDDALEVLSNTVFPKYQNTLKTLNALDFDDLLILTVKLFQNHPSVLEKYQAIFQYIMVDEYQDTNVGQYQFLKLLAGKRRNLCVVGDDDQSIYGWRGANIDNILNFEKDFPGACVIKLEQNYRSLGHILKAANGVIVNNKRRMGKSLWSSKGPGNKVRFHKALLGEDEAQWVVSKIEQLKYEKNRPYQDFAIIYRTNTFSKLFEEALREKRIPYTVVGGTSYFERKEIKDLAAYLKIIANPRDRVSLLRAVNAPKRGLGPAAIGKLIEFAHSKSMDILEAFRNAKQIPDLGDKSIEKAKEFIALIDRYRTRFSKNKNLGEILKALIDEIQYRPYLFTLYKTPKAINRRAENIDGFIHSLSYYEEKESSPTLQGFLEAMALADILEKKDESTLTGITLISFHSAKGLEFPIVFIVGLEEDILPHKKSLLLDENLAEERRLFYVGITRAMKELYLTYTENRMKYGKKTPTVPSRFLDEIPKQVINEIKKEEKVDHKKNDIAAKTFFGNMKAMLEKRENE